MEDIKELPLSEVIEFIEYFDKLTPSQKCTVHPPAGSGGGYGLYNKTYADILDSWIKKKQKEAKEAFTCYEIWRPNIPANGCADQCKECKEKQSLSAST